MTSKHAEIVLNALDSIAAVLPRKFVWSKELRAAYEKSVRILKITMHPGYGFVNYIVPLCIGTTSASTQ